MTAHFERGQPVPATPRAKSRFTSRMARWLLALTVGIATTTTLSVTHRDVGFVRDEGIYFAAARSYAAWVSRVAQDPRALGDRRNKDRAFAINHEHPALLKTLAGLSARMFAKPPVQPTAHDHGGVFPLMRESAAMRLPAQIIAGMGAMLLCWVGWGIGPLRTRTNASGTTSSSSSSSVSSTTNASSTTGSSSSSSVSSTTNASSTTGTSTSSSSSSSSSVSSNSGARAGHRTMPDTRGAGWSSALLAAGWFVLLPRVVFHAGLSTFDVAVAVANFAVVLVYLRALSDWRWGLVLGPLLGVAAAIKLNASFTPVLLAAHHCACLAWQRWRARKPVTLGQWFPLPFLSMAVLAPATFYAVWPWLWHDTWHRLLEYIAFHRDHAYYNMEFLGQNYNLPPLPMSYPWVMLWATVPTTLLVLATMGAWMKCRQDVTQAHATSAHVVSFARPWPARTMQLEGALWVMFAVFPLFLIGLPNVPIFGGTKHFLTAYPFLALTAAFAWSALWKAADLGRWRIAAQCLALAAVLGPGAMAVWHGHPYNLSQYAPLAGGARGAAKLGLNRGFWGYAALPLIDHASRNSQASIELHDLHPLTHEQYVREGRWPSHLRPTPLARAKAGLLFHELHMTAWEVRLWNAMHTTSPTAVIALDDVPLTSLYEATAP